LPLYLLLRVLSGHLPFIRCTSDTRRPCMCLAACAQSSKRKSAQGGGIMLLLLLVLLVVVVVVEARIEAILRRCDCDC
jgi:hypothetical protein